MPRGPKNEEIRVTRCRYPNGDVFFRVSTHGFNHGGFSETNGGFVPVGCRKPLRTRVEAAREVVFRAMQHHIKEAAKMAERAEWPIVFDDTDA